jgi:hypothetical protein
VNKLEDDFVAYVGDESIHDGTVISVHRANDRAEVVLATQNGRSVRCVFEGVENVTTNSPEGMTVYALSEVRTTDPALRKFIFVNSRADEGTAEAASVLEITARSMSSSREDSE